MSLPKNLPKKLLKSNLGPVAGQLVDGPHNDCGKNLNERHYCEQEVNHGETSFQLDTLTGLN